MTGLHCGVKLVVLAGLLASLFALALTACTDEPQSEEFNQNIPHPATVIASESSAVAKEVAEPTPKSTHATSPTAIAGNTPTPTPSPHTTTMQPTDRFVTISVGREHNCALRVDGSVTCWGNNHLFQPPTRAGNKYVAISAGSNFTCALRENGAPACWKSDWRVGEELYPPRVEGLIAISAGNSHACALREDGTPICWGANWGGQTDAPNDKKLVSITSGFDYTCGIDIDAVAICWGNRPKEVLPDGGGPNSIGFVAISGGYASTCGLLKNQRVVCWNKIGEYINVPSQDLLHLGSHVSSGIANRRCGIRKDGSLFCWIYSRGFDYTIESPPSDEKYLEVGTGVSHACGLLVDGSIKCWGTNYSEEISPPRTVATPLPAPSFSEISEICSPGNRISKGSSCKVSDENFMNGYFKFTVTKSGLGILYEGIKLRETQYGKIEATWSAMDGPPGVFTFISARANPDGSWTIDKVLERD